MDISELKKKSSQQPFRRHPWEMVRGGILLHLLRSRRDLPVNHIADIGCGDGYIVNLLAEKNAAATYSAFDTALDKKTLETLQRTSNKDIRFFSDLRQAPINRPKADFILLMDILEHVPDENVLIDEIKEHIPTDTETKWIITVPAFQSVFSNHDLLLGHYRRYTLRQLTGVCRRNNLSVEKKGYFFFSLLIARSLHKLTKKAKPNAPEDTIQNWQGNALITALFTLLLKIDYNIGTIINNIGVHIPGLSCYCICHRSQ